MVWVRNLGPICDDACIWTVRKMSEGKNEDECAWMRCELAQQILSQADSITDKGFDE